MARQFYNDTITKYNTAVQVFPKSVIAGIFGFKRKELLEISRSEREPIKLDSNTFRFQKKQASSGTTALAVYMPDFTDNVSET